MLVIVILVVVIVLCFAMVSLIGAPYLRTLRAKRLAVFDQLQGYQGQKLLDMGSGDGQMVIEALDRDFDAYGVEVNPMLVVASKIRLLLAAGFNERNDKRIRLADMWRTDTSGYSIIFVFLHPSYMNKLHKKLLKDGFDGKLVSFNFPITKVMPDSSEDNIYIYSYRKKVA